MEIVNKRVDQLESGDVLYQTVPKEHTTTVVWVDASGTALLSEDSTGETYIREFFPSQIVAVVVPEEDQP